MSVENSPDCNQGYPRTKQTAGLMPTGLGNLWALDGCTMLWDHQLLLVAFHRFVRGFLGMANPEHVEFVKKSPEWFSEWRSRHKDFLLDLTDATLENLNLNGVDVGPANFNGATVKSCNFRSEGSPNTSFVKVSFDNTTLNECNFGRAVIKECTFRGAKLTRVSFADARIESARFDDAKLNETDFTHATLTDSRLTRIETSKLKMEKSTLSHCDLSRSQLISVNMFHATLEFVTLQSCQLQHAYLQCAKLSHVDLLSSDLSEASFKSALLQHLSLYSTDLYGVVVDSTTTIEHVSDARHCKLDRYTLEYLRSGFTIPQLMDLALTDDVAKLRSQFSGVWGLTHLLSVIVFLLPYAWFLSQQWITAKFREVIPGGNDVETIAVWDATLRYVVNGGVDWRHGYAVNWQSFLPFVVVLLYNALRTALLVKTKQMETRQHVTGMPVPFSLANSRKWNFIFRAVRWGYWVTLCLVLFNTLHFLTMRIPAHIPGVG